MQKSNEANTIRPFKGKVVLLYLMQSHDAFSASIAVKELQIEELQAGTTKGRPFYLYIYKLIVL